MTHRRMLNFLLITAALILVGVAVMFVLSLTASRQEPLGVPGGQLPACPDTPNCVSTQAENRSHRMAPLTFSVSPERAWESLRQLLARLPRCTVVTDDGRYMHVEVRSAVFRFTDDVEFLLEPDSQRIHFRSASRVGLSDLGANRQRMAAIRVAFDESLSGSSTVGR